MKKLFISIPMRDRTEEQICYSIEKMHKIANAVFDENFTVINSYNPELKDIPPIDALGKTISLMTEADYFIGIGYSSMLYRGCTIETEVAQSYGIPNYMINVDWVLTPEERPEESGAE